MNRFGVRQLVASVAIPLCALGLLLLGPAARLAPARAAEGDALEVPFIFWGGDVATFLANGGLKTQPDTIFAGQGLNLHLTPGDNFDQQVQNYLSGKSPFLRGTFSMLGQASEKLARDDGSRPVIFLQLTWSAGDHLVTRPGINRLDDLKGKKIALQKGGPHVGMLGDILRTARLNWGDIQVAWTDDVTGDKGPAARFRKDASVDACFAITPDMLALVGGLDKAGTGDKDSVKGAHVLVSTAHMKRSIADVYACRKDFFDAHRDLVEKFAAGYLKASEELVDLRKRPADPKYKAVLKMTQDIYGKDAIASADDADGLISDAVFVGLPGNISFFTDKGNLSGFDAKQKAALDLAVALGDARERHDFLKPAFDYDKIKQLGGLAGKAPPESKFREDVKALPQDTIYSFNISFQPDQSTFPESQYGDDFQRALEEASLFGRSIVLVRGHSDPTNLIRVFKDQGLQKGILTEKDEALYLKDGTKVDLTNVKQVLEIINKEDFGSDDLKRGAEFLLDLSRKRAEQVRQAVIDYARSKGYRIDKSQIRPVGVGCVEPVTPYPKNLGDLTEEALQKNRRVEFRIIKVAVEIAPEIDY